jgi:hypothetical protein
MSSKNNLLNSLLFLLFLFFIFTPLLSYPGEKSILIREEFNNIDNWKPLFFPKVRKHTIYTIEAQGDHTYLRAESNASASALIYKKEFNSYAFPIIRWRWKAQNVYQKGDAKTRKGDDYPIRIYVNFKYDPEKSGWWKKIRYNLAKTAYGSYPPHSSLNYIWANKEHEETVITSSYTDQSKMIPLEKGEVNVGKWQTHEIDIIRDYQMAFGKKPPEIASLAIMNDSDNTGEQSISYIDYIEISKR